jgi:hypothetical protein
VVLKQTKRSLNEDQQGKKDQSEQNKAKQVKQIQKK